MYIPKSQTKGHGCRDLNQQEGQLLQRKPVLLGCTLLNLTVVDLFVSFGANDNGQNDGVLGRLV